MSSIPPALRSAPRPQPQQQRSTETVGRILDAASALLDEVGFDRLTTNLICQRAGLTPPALYRHFAHKYAVMEELGRRLMEAQNAALYGFLATQAQLFLPVPALAAMLRGQLELTRGQPGARWIMRSLHSTPALVHVRLESHQSVVDHLAARHRAMAGMAAPDVVARRYRIAVDAGYAIVELLLDQPMLDEEAVLLDTARMIAGLLEGPDKNR
ncbi:TetR/AcrR family transcriptional regulator [Sandaracinobacteroides saxicola]|uniref:TetR/AcrR family transcriptional regulator n=1 Tax=Sandaracinobacteroides saxicola TaxID=2759707 RepID=A0A7G5ILE3_9SPHN|nr:TetR/AcrR family transcriptional regulator [Sandaracinobacteroides saxicola]QMW24185.1 TetR/AcrR family transcriptional regulator [Sandaracinobacteroides saxicola]